MRALVSGYYGYGNVGDEAILAALAQELPVLLPEVELEVLSGDPQSTRRVYGLEATHRSKTSRVWAALRQADLLIEGGGGLIQDATSVRSPAYYLGLLGMARLAGTPWAVFCQGVGPLSTWLWRRLTVALFRGARLLIVRDQASADLLHRWGLSSPAEVAADPALLLRPAPEDEVLGWLSGAGATLPEDYWLVVPRQTKLVDAAAAATAAEGLAAGERKLVVLPFQAADEDLAREMAGSLGALALPAAPDPRIAAALVNGARGVLSVRLHALVFAAGARVEAYGIEYDPKVASFCDSLGYPHSASPTSSAVEEWARAVEGGQAYLRAESVERLQSSCRHAFARLAALLRDAGVRGG